jgi:hypothetical protein
MEPIDKKGPERRFGTSYFKIWSRVPGEAEDQEARISGLACWKKRNFGTNYTVTSSRRHKTRKPAFLKGQKSRSDQGSFGPQHSLKKEEAFGDGKVTKSAFRRPTGATGRRRLT